jgi:hypothetical protein
MMGGAGFIALKLAPGPGRKREQAEFRLADLPRILGKWRRPFR